MTFYTIGYGGRSPEELLDLLGVHRIAAIADLRIRPDRSSMGSYTRARAPEKGIEALLASRGITYHHLLELGNVFLDRGEWHEPYRQLIALAGDLLTDRLCDLPTPLCLLCAEKRVADCHRRIIADHLVACRGWQVQHIE